MKHDASAAAAAAFAVCPLFEKRERIEFCHTQARCVGGSEQCHMVLLQFPAVFLHIYLRGQ